MGGIQNGDLSKSCLEIDANLNIRELAPMSSGVYNMGLAAILDNYIFVIGGNTAKTKAVDKVRAFDIASNTWHKVGDLNKARSSTSCCAYN